MALNLKIVPCKSIVPLADYSVERVAFLEIIIRDSGAIRNPLPVAAAENDKYLLLDDAAILETAYRLKIDYLPVQINEFVNESNISAGVRIHKWNREFIDKFRMLFPRVFTSLISSGKPLNGRKLIEIIIVDSEKEPLRLWFKRDSKNRLPGAFFDFLAFLKHHFGFVHQHSIGNDNPISSGEMNNSAVLNCQDITAKDISCASESGYLFPAELLSFDCGSRILGINYPVHILNDSVPVEDKEQFLHELINLRINSGNTRYISSGVYLLNY